MITLQKTYTEERVQQLRVECDRLASRYVQALCAFLPAHINLAAAHDCVASKILALCEHIADVQQAIEDELLAVPCKEDKSTKEPTSGVRLQDVAGAIISPVAISDESKDKRLMSELVTRNGLEMLQFIPQRQATGGGQGTFVEAPTEGVVPITDAERTHMQRIVERLGIIVWRDGEGIYYVEHPTLLPTTQDCINESELYQLVRSLSEQARTQERVTQA